MGWVKHSYPSPQQLAAASVRGQAGYQMVSWDFPAAMGLPGSILRNLYWLTLRAIHTCCSQSGGLWKGQGLQPCVGHVQEPG